MVTVLRRFNPVWLTLCGTIVLSLGSFHITQVVAPSIKKRDNISINDTELFMKYLQLEGYYTGADCLYNIFRFKYLDKVLFTESIVDTDNDSRVIASARFWKRGESKPTRLLLIDGKVVVAIQR